MTAAEGLKRDIRLLELVLTLDENRCIPTAAVEGMLKVARELYENMAALEMRMAEWAGEVA